MKLTSRELQRKTNLALLQRAKASGVSYAGMMNNIRMSSGGPLEKENVDTAEAPPNEKPAIDARRARYARLSNSRITGQNDAFNAIAKSVIADQPLLDDGYYVTVGHQGGARTQAEQKALFDSHKSHKDGTPGNESHHQMGSGMDFQIYDKKGNPINPKRDTPEWDLYGTLFEDFNTKAEKEGYKTTWGGTWESLDDPYHMQIDNFDKPKPLTPIKIPKLDSNPMNSMPTIPTQTQSTMPAPPEVDINTIRPSTAAVQDQSQILASGGPITPNDAALQRPTLVQGPYPDTFQDGGNLATSNMFNSLQSLRKVGY